MSGSHDGSEFETRTQEIFNAIDKIPSYNIAVKDNEIRIIRNGETIVINYDPQSDTCRISTRDPVTGKDVAIDIASYVFHRISDKQHHFKQKEYEKYSFTVLMNALS